MEMHRQKDDEEWNCAAKKKYRMGKKDGREKYKEFRISVSLLIFGNNSTLSL